MNKKNTLNLLSNWISTNQPGKKFAHEVQLMLYFYKKLKRISKFFQRRIYYKYHCEVSSKARISSTVSFPHPIAIIIGSNAIIEDNCIIYQCVTLGATLNQNNHMPYIKHGTIVYSGAKIIGNVTIGTNCIIGANSVVTKSIPDNSIVVGVNKVHRRKDIL